MSCGKKLLTIQEASQWASEYLSKNVSPANISYLIQYGKVKKHGRNGSTAVKKHDLISYYKTFNKQRETDWREKLGADLNWFLSFDNLTEKDTIKRLHEKTIHSRNFLIYSLKNLFMINILL